MAALSPTAALTQENDGANDTQPESPPPALDDKPADGVDDDAEAQAEHARVLQIQNSLEEAREASLNDECALAHLKTDAAFGSRRRPLYAARAALLSSIPCFWCDVLQSDPTLTLLETDIDVLRHATNFAVVDIKEERLASQPSFELELHFSGGCPWFSDKLLVKTFRLNEVAGVWEVTATEPAWARRKRLVSEMEPPSPHAPSPTKRARGSMKSTFVAWFCSSEVFPSSDVHNHTMALASHLATVYANPLVFYEAAAPGAM